MVTNAAAFSALRYPSTSAADLTTRQVSRFGSIALCLYPLLLVEPIKALSEVVPTWWTTTALEAIVLPSLAMLVSTFFTDTRWTIRLAWAVSISYAAVITSFAFVWNGLPTDDGSGAWLTALAGVVSVAAVVAMPVPAAVAYLLASVTATRMISASVAERTSATEFFTDLPWGLFVAAVPFAIAIFALETGRRRDGAQARAKRRAEATAAEQSRRRERANLDAITHDRVMSIMFAASREGTNTELQTQAIATLAQLDALGADDDLNRAVSPVELVAEAESAAAIVDPDTEVHNAATIGPTTTYPLDIVHAIVSAMSEALHNSVRHAGPDAARSVLFTMDSNSLTVEIADDGVGFDQELVPADRLGIPLSIRGRMEQIAGGTATITSAPGAGTRVILSWRRTP
ncbi:sensor histidine kinase [Williamsia sp.]|uniref:sensor histidine kinase n=1 Tax=Williamsia sp. TaxID=1872085 RepID=UPI002F93E085